MAASRSVAGHMMALLLVVAHSARWVPVRPFARGAPISTTHACDPFSYIHTSMLGADGLKKNEREKKKTRESHQHTKHLHTTRQWRRTKPSSGCDMSPVIRDNLRRLWWLYHTCLFYICRYGYCCVCDFFSTGIIAWYVYFIQRRWYYIDKQKKNGFNEI